MMIRLNVSVAQALKTGEQTLCYLDIDEMFTASLGNFKLKQNLKRNSKINYPILKLLLSHLNKTENRRNGKLKALPNQNRN
ncbi:hypothetical protein Ocin01_08329 [Orchesella cincta]|uniref:Uncharacterized protein n=1 Tax=Orchesella cincta TaxID=48709 RepID=A0A1D2MZB7_ORCCI|nr:hypothetical protein Ocin01_08329 [Orchesella cincta]